MRRWLAAALLYALAAPGVAAVQAGQSVPALSAARLDGAALRLEDLRGRVVYLDFWASWCPPCREAMPEYEKLWRELEPRGFSVVGVNLDTARAAAERALVATPVSFPVVLDPRGEWPRVFDPPAMPTAYLIDRQGVVRHVHAGFRRSDLPALRERIDALLREEP